MFEISGMSGDEIVYINGKFCKAKEAAISPFDRGFVLGDGIYEVAPVVNSKSRSLSTDLAIRIM